RSVAGRSGPSRRKLLTMGGGSLLGVAAAGAGAWAWWGPAGTGQAKGGPGTGPSPKASRKPKQDYLWQLQVSDPPSDLWPAAASIPFPIGDLVALITGAGLATAHAADGAASWGPTQIDNAWQVGTDGKDLYRVTQLDKYQGHMGDDWPLILETVDLATGKPKKRLPEMSEFNGVIFENQLLCVADQVIYLAVGQGKNDQDGFQHDQPWFLAAVDARTAKRLWSTPLPARPEKSERLHFLDARVVADRLILLQETAGGAVRANARDRRTGRLLWDKPLPGIKPDAVRSMMTTDDQHLYLGLGALRALRLSDGGEAWNLSKARPGSSFGPPAVKDGVVYAVQKGRGVVGVDAGGGAVRWEEKGGGDAAKGDLTDRPVLGTKYLYSRSPSGLRAIDLASRATARTYRTTGTRFVAHREAEVVIALGGFFLAAFPLQ
ncbi:hypothetical protein QR77_41850, partial [Streptomyces sp. 150FB]|uniref:outer membrane protein assembly factor BamB family protein n=1 Tax=Streptomyces sp. 150FB TaxID=1576605 RepID=UPI0005896992